MADLGGADMSIADLAETFIEINLMTPDQAHACRKLAWWLANTTCAQLITLAEAQKMVAAALRVHAGRCEEGESITEKYLRRYPRSKKTRSWSGAMVHMRTMNGIWKPDGHGYTINFAEAWVLPLEQARKTVSGIYEDHGGTYYRASAAAIRAAATGTKEGDDGLLQA